MPGKPHRKGVFALAGALALICAGDAAARTYEPTRKDDPVPGKCKPNNCSLREAMLAANASNDGDDRILLGRGRYEMERPASAGSGEDGSWWTYGATVRGEGSGRTTLDANGLDRVMQFGNFTESSTLRGLRLTGGSGSGFDPGGILGTGGKMTLKDVTVTGNVSAGGPGGGAYFQPRLELNVVNSRFIDNATTDRGGGLNLVAGSQAAVAVTIRNSRISGNSAGYGGGIYSTVPSLSITRSTISGNSASEGGGLDLRPANALPVTRIFSSTISGNTATNKAGGIMADGNPPTAPDFPEEPDLHVTNSTVADNKSDGDAGGVMGDNAAVLDVENSSIGFNIANNDSSGSAVGGGVYQHGNANFSIDDSVIAHNVTLGTMGSDSDCSATEVFSGAGNAISVFDDGCEVSFTTPYNVYSASQIAQNVADNGGPTETMALTQDSAAIGFANDCPKRDQRGKLRPANCDSGSFENRPKRH